MLIDSVSTARVYLHNKVQFAYGLLVFVAHSHFQVYNFETKNLLSELEVHTEVVFWKWVNNEMMMIVTETNVLQWSVFRGTLHCSYRWKMFAI